jgi:hypothetical protein
MRDIRQVVVCKRQKVTRGGDEPTPPCFATARERKAHHMLTARSRS